MFRIGSAKIVNKHLKYQTHELLQTFYVVFAVSILLNIFLLKGCEIDKQIAESNSNQITGIKAREVVYNGSQMKSFLAKNDTVTASKIKVKYITKYIRLTDTIRYLDTVPNEYESTNELESDIRQIIIDNSCYKLNVLSFPDTSYTDLDIIYNIGITDYWKHEVSPFVKRVWIWNFDKIHEVKAVNICSGDSINVGNNIKVIKR